VKHFPHLITRPKGNRRRSQSRLTSQRRPPGMKEHTPIVINDNSQPIHARHHARRQEPPPPRWARHECGDRSLLSFLSHAIHFSNKANHFSVRVHVRLGLSHTTLLVSHTHFFFGCGWCGWVGWCGEWFTYVLCLGDAATFRRHSREFSCWWPCSWWWSSSFSESSSSSFSPRPGFVGIIPFVPIGAYGRQGEVSQRT